MAIQKFKHGQEITSAKLNEIVSFLNTLENVLTTTSSFNTNIDNKLNNFRNEISTISNQVKDLLNTSESFDTLLQSYLDLKALYEQLVSENVNALLENIFSPSNITVDSNGIFVIGGISTGVQLTTLIGPTGPKGDAGLNGINGLNGKTILTGSVVDNNSGVQGDLFLETSTLNIYIKNNNAFVFLVNIKGATGATGPQGPGFGLQFRYKSEPQSTPTTLPNDATKYLEFKYFLSTETTNEVNQKPWITIRTRGDVFYPVLTTSGNNVLLNWSTDSPTSNLFSAVNVRGPIGLTGPKGDSGESFKVLGLKSSSSNLPTTGDDGDAWFVGETLPYDIYIWDSSLEDWVDVGPLQGPAGEAGAAGEQGPIGLTGVRGSRIFNVEEDSELPSSTSFGDPAITLLVNDLFIISENGKIKRVAQTTPSFVLEDVYQIPLENQLILKPKLLENVTKGDLLQFVGVQGGNKLVARASQSQRTIGSNTVLNANDRPELILGVAKTDGTTNSFIDVVDFGQINNIGGYIESFAEGSLLYFDSSGTTLGGLTATEPTGNTHIRLVVAAYIGGGQKILQVRLGEAHKVADIKGLQTELNNLSSTTHTHGNITNAGAIGNTADLVAVTTTSGVLTTASRIGIDSRSSFTPSSHTHGNITNAGAIGSTSGLPIITTTSGVLTTGSFGATSGTFAQGNDSRLSDARTPLYHTHSINDVDFLTLGLNSKQNNIVNVIYPNSRNTTASTTAEDAGIQINLQSNKWYYFTFKGAWSKNTGSSVFNKIYLVALTSVTNSILSAHLYTTQNQSFGLASHYSATFCNSPRTTATDATNNVSTASTSSFIQGVCGMEGVFYTGSSTGLKIMQAASASGGGSFLFNRSSFVAFEISSPNQIN